jgi:hypothetical protein
MHSQHPINKAILRFLGVTLLMLLHTSSEAQIISHEINDTLIGPSAVTLDLDSDNNNDYQFEIIALSPGVLAARVITYAPSTILDNSTFGYPDTLNYGSPVVGYFYSGTAVLGTFNNAGQFSGGGDKYLGIKLNSGGLNLYGWIKLNCSANRDTLIIISCAWQSNEGTLINAGDGDPASIDQQAAKQHYLSVFPNPAKTGLRINTQKYLQAATISLFDISGNEVLTIKNVTGNTYFMDVSDIPEGFYLINISSMNGEQYYNKLSVVK